MISAFWGLAGASTEWTGHLVLPCGQDPYGSDIIASHARYVKADLVITLMDVWPLNADQVREIRTVHGIPVAHWMPVDCDPLSAMDERHLKHTGAIPVAMSRFGQRMLAEAGLDALYVPHGIEATRVFTPAGRDEARKALGVEDRFVVGMNAANKDAIRKGFPEQMLAFAEFRRNHPEALLMMHSLAAAPGALDLQTVAGRAGYPLARSIEKALEAQMEQAEFDRAQAEVMAAKMGIMADVRFCDQYAYLTGLLQPQAMAAWMSAADLGTNCAYGEGFGLATVEFQATGTPVVVTDATAMPELAGPGWRVKGEPFWNSAHAAFWDRPSIAGIAAAYEDAYLHAAERREASREFALQYDADRVLTEHWAPALEQIMERANAGMSPGVLPAPGTGRLASAEERDATVDAIAGLYNDEVIGADVFAERASRALSARTPADLAGLTDLPAAA